MSGQADAPRGGQGRPEGADLPDAAALPEPASAGGGAAGDGSGDRPTEAADHPLADDAGGGAGEAAQHPADATDGMAGDARAAEAAGAAAAGVSAGDAAAAPAVVQAIDAGSAPAAEAAPDGAPDPALLAEGARIAEALIFASDRPVTPAMLGAVLPPGIAPGAVVAALAEACEGRGVMLAEVAGGWAFRTAPDLAQRLTKVVQAPRRLPRAAMEALSIIAYHQPCTRGEIEEIRGAALAQTTLEALLELGLVAPRGRREVPGRPTLWGTTPRFLEQFGLKALSDLPRKEELVTAETGPALPLGGAGEAPAVSADEVGHGEADATEAEPPDATTAPSRADTAPEAEPAEPPGSDTPAGATP